MNIGKKKKNCWSDRWLVCRLVGCCLCGLDFPKGYWRMYKRLGICVIIGGKKETNVKIVESNLLLFFSLSFSFSWTFRRGELIHLCIALPWSWGRGTRLAAPPDGQIPRPLCVHEGGWVGGWEGGGDSSS